MILVQVFVHPLYSAPRSISPINGIREPGLERGSSQGSTFHLPKQVEGGDFDRIEVEG
jgi:hypothetical protein